MKKLLIILLCLPVIGFGQGWSNYYIDANINKNVNVSGYVNQTISTIDYGALANANAQREKNRLERQIYTNEQEKFRILDIANNPVKAYDYGRTITFTIKTWQKKYEKYKPNGFKEYTVSRIAPHSSLFVAAGSGRLENVSEDGITTEIIFYSPRYNKDNCEILSYEDFEKWKNKNDNEKEKIEIPMPKKRDYKTTPAYNKALREYRKINNDKVRTPLLKIEDIAKMHNMKVGELNTNGAGGDEIFVHKKDINRATVYGVKGFKGTLIWEDDYQYTITDNYSSRKFEGNSIRYFVKVRTYGDKDEVTFEQLEGRRYYLRRLIEKVISTATVTNTKY